MWLGLAVPVALQLYYVQEMIAAFVIFCILFALAAGAGLLLFILDRASERTLAWAGLRTPRLARVARRGWTLLEELSKKQLHRPRSETAQ
jgi:type IV secretory pathway TrbD component